MNGIIARIIISLHRNIMKNELLHIQGLKRGSYKDFTALYEQYVPYLFAFILDITKSKTLAEDIVQDVFIKIWTLRKDIDETLSFKSYLFTIARNMIISEFRQRIHNAEFIDYIEYLNKEDKSSITIEEKLDFDEFNKLLQCAKQKLTERQREIFVLCKETGKSPAEVAEQLSISDQSVRNQLSIALKILRKELDKYNFLFSTFFI